MVKFVIMCGGYYEQWETPKQLQTINGEPLVARTVRLLQENGIKTKDIFISSNDERFDAFGVERLQHENTYRYEGGQLKGYWLDAFYPNFKSNTKATFLFGDVYYTEAALQKIIKAPAAGNILFGSASAKNSQHKNWGEPFAYVVNDIKTFYAGIKAVKKLQDEGKTKRVPIVWELYRYLNGLDVNVQAVKDDTYFVIDDETNDADTPAKLQRMRGDLEIKANVFTVLNINAIGGGESFLYYLAKKYSDRDITVYYKEGDARQIERLKKYCRVIRYTGEKIKCKRAFFNYNRAFIDNIDAEEYYQIIHTGYYENKLKVTDDKRIKYIAVSKAAADSFKKQTGHEAELCYNPVDVAAGKPLILISATRLTENKGKDRIIKFANALSAAGVNYLWFIFTNDNRKPKNDNIVYIPPRLNFIDYLQWADWFVQLSDEGEAFCYSVVEALLCGVPCIVTPCKVFKELKLNDKNSIILDFNIESVPVNKIKKGLTIPKYTPPADNYKNLLAAGKSTYEPPKDTGDVLVEVIRTFDDVVTGDRRYIGTQFKTTNKRALTLVCLGVVKRI